MKFHVNFWMLRIVHSLEQGRHERKMLLKNCSNQARFWLTQLNLMADIYIYFFARAQGAPWGAILGSEICMGRRLDI